jgi:hypothetical protein
MRLAYLLAGNAPVVKKYQIGATAGTVPGVPYLYPTLSDTDGVLACSTTAAADVLGVSVDVPSARQTAQQSDNSDPSRFVSLIVNPGAVYKARLCGGAGAGTALTPLTNTVASTTGLLTTLALGTAYDDGFIWGYTGANAGHLRKVTAVGGTNETPIIAFPFDIAVGDTFLAATFGPGEDSGIQLTTNLDEVNATADIQSTDNFRCLDFYQKDASDRGNTESYVELMSIDHVYSGNIT